MPRTRGLSCISRLRSMSTITMLANVIVFVFLFAMWEENHIENEILKTPNHAHFNNEMMAKTGQNYPVCKNINALDLALIIEEKNRISEEKKYNEMLLNGLMNCGNIRVGLGIFSKR